MLAGMEENTKAKLMVKWWLNEEQLCAAEMRVCELPFSHNERLSHSEHGTKLQLVLYRSTKRYVSRLCSSKWYLVSQFWYLLTNVMIRVTNTRYPVVLCNIDARLLEQLDCCITLCRSFEQIAAYLRVYLI